VKYRINPNYSKAFVIAQATQEIKGMCPGVEGEIMGTPVDLFKTGTGSLKLDVRRFASNDKIRDFGIRTHVDVARHSFAELTQLKIVSSTQEEAGLSLQWEGTFKYRLKSPKVSGEAKLREENGRIYIEASFQLALKDVGLDTPKMIIMKSESVKVEVKIEAIPMQ
jgi:hypothetical protein